MSASLQNWAWNHTGQAARDGNDYKFASVRADEKAKSLSLGNLDFDYALIGGEIICKDHECRLPVTDKWLARTR